MRIPAFNKLGKWSPNLAGWLQKNASNWRLFLFSKLVNLEELLWLEIMSTLLPKFNLLIHSIFSILQSNSMTFLSENRVLKWSHRDPAAIVEAHARLQDTVGRQFMGQYRNYGVTMNVKHLKWIKLHIK